ncbi:reverse transcriptase domain-containing protein [Tanacetum coccineum]
MTHLINVKPPSPCPYRTFAYRRMPFGLCNASGASSKGVWLQFFHVMMRKPWKSSWMISQFFGDSFSSCAFSIYDRNAPKVLRLKRQKVDVIAKIASSYLQLRVFAVFSGLPDIYLRFIQMKLTQAPILVAPDWDLPFEIMCDASDFAVGAVLGQRKTKHFQPIHYASQDFDRVFDVAIRDNKKEQKIRRQGPPFLDLKITIKVSSRKKELRNLSLETLGIGYLSWDD